MPKHILAIVSSPRKNGTSELLVDQFIAGAVAATPAMAEAYAAGLHCERPAPLSAFRSLPPLGPGAFLLSVCFPRADLDKLFSRRPHFSCVCL